MSGLSLERHVVEAVLVNGLPERASEAHAARRRGVLIDTRPDSDIHVPSFATFTSDDGSISRDR